LNNPDDKAIPQKKSLAIIVESQGIINCFVSIFPVSVKKVFIQNLHHKLLKGYSLVYFI